MSSNSPSSGSDDAAWTSALAQTCISATISVYVQALVLTVLSFGIVRPRSGSTYRYSQFLQVSFQPRGWHAMIMVPEENSPGIAFSVFVKQVVPHVKISHEQATAMASQSVTAPATFSSAVPKPACRRPFQPANHAQTAGDIFGITRKALERSVNMVITMRLRCIAGRSQRSRLVVAAASGERRPQTVREQLGARVCDVAWV